MFDFGRLKKRFLKKRLPLAESFRLFKETLAGNNKALEIIADLGEKLGGDYLFDEVYIREAYSELGKALESSISSFHQLTQRHYPGLRKAYSRIDARLKAVVGPAVPDSRIILSIDQLGEETLSEAGGKMSNLAQAKARIGLNVPPGFVITASAYARFLEHNSINPGMASEFTDEALESLRARALAGEIPADVEAAIKGALERLSAKCGKDCTLAVRSSAEEEDGELSFAGQFETVLNVPVEYGAAVDAYRKVVASLFTQKACSYQAHAGIRPGQLKMAVGCLAMVDAVASGVAYTADPAGKDKNIIVSAAWGLGNLVVEGQVDTDRFTIKRSGETVDTHIGDKGMTAVRRTGGGIEAVPTPEDKRKAPSLSGQQLGELAAAALKVEKYFGGPQDIEWAVGKDGKFYILQSRPLKVAEPDSGEEGGLLPDKALSLISGKGLVVQRGAASGRVFIVRREDDIARAPKGAVIVAKTDSSSFARIVPKIAAIITDTGSQTSHMASVCREFRLPTVVGAGDATQRLEPGRLVTLFANDGMAVFDGAFTEAVKKVEADVFGMEKVYEYRKKRQVLRRISRLNLIDPLMEEFTPEGCRTMHDIIRFMHEKSVAELVENAKEAGRHAKGRGAVKVELPVPAGLLVVDIGGGLKPGARAHGAGLEDITSLPLLALVRGMAHPGVWRTDAVPLKAGDFLSSMVRMQDLAASAEEYVGYNVAVASSDYVNLSLRFGYHFNMLDCYMSENPRNNHIYFRFVGGATDIAKRSRRVRLISIILKEYGFRLKTRGDLIIARMANIDRETMDGLLDNLGRLVAFTRQMDAMLHTDEAVGRYAGNFLNGVYGEDGA